MNNSSINNMTMTDLSLIANSKSELKQGNKSELQIITNNNNIDQNIIDEHSCIENDNLNENDNEYL